MVLTRFSLTTAFSEPDQSPIDRIVMMYQSDGTGDVGRACVVDRFQKLLRICLSRVLRVCPLQVKKLLVLILY